MSHSWFRCVDRFAEAARHPARTWRSVVRKQYADTLLPPRSRGATPMVHVAAFTRRNAGDALLCMVLEDLFDSLAGPIRWRSLHAHREVTADDVATMNAAAAVVVGGGGLFLGDTNPNAVSGWQWKCSRESLAAIESPLILFAIGYNVFRGQGRLGERFQKHLRQTVEKAVFVGLRNHGSIRAVREYLPESLHGKIVYQPCMTTVMRRLYGEALVPGPPTAPMVALNCAFDRSDKRFGADTDAILAQIAAAAKRLGERCRICYYANMADDERMLPHLDAAGVRYDLVRLYKMSARRIVETFSRPTLVMGMRGHSQLAPFGCGVPILSLISHEKMKWFLEDIEHPEWGVELTPEGLADAICQKATAVLADPAGARRAVMEAQDRLWDVTRSNLATITTAVGHRPSR